jgi:hypothetical protein
MGIETLWLDEEDDIDKIDFSKTLFLTEGSADWNIPLRDDCFYILHNCNAKTYAHLSKLGRCITLQVYTDDVLTRKGAKQIAPCIYTHLAEGAIYMPWATNLLPHEIDAMKEHVPEVKKEQEIHWVGTIGGGVHGNESELTPFINACKEHAFAFIHNNPWTKPVSSEETVKLMQKSFMAPAIVGSWQKEKGYIPCRIFKNISYGQLGITNSPRTYELFEKKIVYHSDTRELFLAAKEKLETLKIEEVHELMDFVKEKHTFVNRIDTLLTFFRECLKERSVQPVKRLKVLHLTFHKGTLREFERIADKLCLDVTNWYIPDLPKEFFDPGHSGNALYNVGHDRAKRIWEAHKQTFNGFDVIVTSDTAPLSRIFLQNGWKKPLIVWISNRFDYADTASLDCQFPDPEYYALIRAAAKADNVRVIANTEFEHHYARSKGVETGMLTIKPFMGRIESVATPAIPESVDKANTFFLPSYVNETTTFNLKKKCKELGIPTYQGSFNGPAELKGFKGVIHLPYAYSTIALFANMQLGLPYFVPSKKFLGKMFETKGYWHQDKQILQKEGRFDLSEWYSGENSSVITTFDSWEDLQKKVKKADYKKMKMEIKTHARAHREEMVRRWHKVFDELAPYVCPATGG